MFLEGGSKNERINRNRFIGWVALDGATSWVVEWSRIAGKAML